jgi:hypothetical protein
MSYPREVYLQIMFPDNNDISDVIPRDVPGCQWNDAEAPQGLRLRVILKSMLAVNKIMQKLGNFFSLSYKTLGPQIVSVQTLKTFNSIRHLSMSVS